MGLNISTFEDAGFNAGEANGLSVLKRSDHIVAQRDAALALIVEAANQIADAYEKSRKAISLVLSVTSSEDYHYRYAHRDNADYRALFGDDFDVQKAVSAFRTVADADIWESLITATGLRAMMDAEALRDFRAQLSAEVPEVSQDNLRATFENLFLRRNDMFLRGLANVFSKLDRRFKSHDAFKIGSRIIVSSVAGLSDGFSRHSRGAEVLNDVDRVLRRLSGMQDSPGYLVSQLDAAQGRFWGPKQLDVDVGYARVKIYKNGNCHLFLGREQQVLVNAALAQFYGSVVPDGVDAGVDVSAFRRMSAGLPTKDFAFYPTPEKTVDLVMAEVHLSKGDRILEPSAGTGALLRGLWREQAKTMSSRYEEYRISPDELTIDAVEIHPARCERLRADPSLRCRVTEANFLDLDAVPIYDKVVMNPPFSGTTYIAHVMQAFDFLKPGGCLVAVLPVTADLGETPRHISFHRWLDRAGRYSWHDLPMGSFAESGTMINTTVLKLWKQ